MAANPMYGCTRAVDQQFSEISIASLADAAELIFATRRILFRN